MQPCKMLSQSEESFSGMESDSEVQSKSDAMDSDAASSWDPDSDTDAAAMSPDGICNSGGPSDSEDWDSESYSDGDTFEKINSTDEPHFLLYLLKGCFDGTCAPGGCQMKELIWSRLPTELVERILVMLPAASRCRFRAVCKTWLGLLSGAASGKMGAAVKDRSEPPICALEYLPGRLSRFGRCASDVSYLGRDDVMRLGKPDVSHLSKPRVYRLDLSFLPKGFQHFSQYTAEDGLICIQKFKRRPSFHPQSGDFLSVDSDSEWDNHKVTGLTFCVVNPLTRSWKELPPEFGEDVEDEDCYLKLVVDKSRVDSFKLIVISDRPYQGDRWDKRCTASIYSSDTDNWTMICLEVGGGLLLDPDDRRRWPQFVLCKNIMFSAYDFDHFLLHRVDDGTRLRSSPLLDPAFDELKAAWHYSMGKVFRILEHDGEIYCVDSSVDRLKLKFGVWKLDQKFLLWQLVSLVPEKLNRRSLRASGDHVDGADFKYFLYGASMVGDYICLTIGVKSPRKKRLWSHLVAYHIAEDSWELLWHQLDYHRSANDYLILQPRL